MTARLLPVITLLIFLCGVFGGCTSESTPGGSDHGDISAATESPEALAENAPVKIGAIRSAKPVARRASSTSKSAAQQTGAGTGDERTTEPTVLVYGRITTAKGDPACSVTVTLKGYNKEQFSQGEFKSQVLADAVTNKRGEYEVRGPILDFIVMMVSGDAPEMQISPDREKLYKNNEPVPGFTRIKQDIELLEGHNVAGQVVNEKGESMAGLPVHARPKFNAGDKRMQKTSETTSTAEGGFELENLPAGEWIIGTSHPDYAPVVELITVPTTGPITLRLAARGGTITGHVIHKATGASAANVDMMLMNTGSNTIASLGTIDIQRAKSAADGSFRFDHVSSGTKFLRTLPGKDVKLSLAPPELGKLSVNEGATTNVTVYVYPGHTISGRVFDKDTDEALAGVKIRGGNGQTEVTSDADGNYKLENVLSNVISGGNRAVDLSAKLEGYEPETPAYQSGVRVNLPDDTLEVTKDIPMLKKLMVRGVVVTSTDKPIPHAKVTLYNNRTHSSNPEKTAVKPDGTFELETLPFVQDVIEAEAAGYGPVISEKIDVAAADVEGIKIVMEPGGTVEGRVLDPKGQPLAGAAVLQHKDYGIFSTYKEAAVTGEKGIYLINDAPANLQLKARMEGYADSETVDLSLAAGETRTGVDITLRTSMKIAGRVVDAARKPATGLSMSIQNNTEGIYKHANTDKDGKFEVDGLADGLYEIYVFSSPSKRVPGVKAGTTDLEIILDGKKENSGANKLIGTVVDDATSKPISNFTIDGYEDQITKLNEPGQFQFVGIGDNFVYNITISSPGYDSQKFQTKSGRGGETIEQEFRLGKGGAIVGRVVEAGSSKPVPGVTVVNWGSAQYYERQRASPKSHSVTDEKGSFVLAPAPTGTNQIDIKAKAPFSDEFVTAEVHSEQTTDLGDIELHRGGTITGVVVRGADEEPVPGQSVRASGWSNNGNSQNHVQQNATTDAEGKFKFEALPAMRFTVSVGNVSKTVNLEAEGTADIKLVLGGVTISGTIMRGNSAVQAHISATGRDGTHISANAQTGEYTIKNVPPDTYNFSVNPQDNTGGYNPLQETVEIPDQAEFTKDFQLPDGRMEVTVTDATGEPVQGAIVSLSQKSSNTGFDQRWLTRTAGNKVTDASGKATFEGLDAGAFGVNARKDGVGTAMKPDVQVNDNGPVQVQLQLSNEGGTLVSVALSYATGQGIPEAWCYLHGPNGPFTHSAKRGADGTMTIENIPPGTYTTNVSYWSHSQSEKTIEIKANETVQIEDVLYPAGAIHWTLKKADGSPAGGAVVTVTPINTDPPEEQRSGSATNQGQFVQRGLAAGTYQATAQLDGKPGVTETFTIAAGENVEKTTTAPGW